MPRASEPHGQHGARDRERTVFQRVGGQLMDN